jgi:EB module
MDAGEHLLSVFAVINTGPQVRFGDPCVLSDVCADDNTECRDGRCQCRSGFGSDSSVTAPCGNRVTLHFMYRLLSAKQVNCRLFAETVEHEP